MPRATIPVASMPTARTCRSRHGNTLVLVTAILVLLVIIATAFLVRSQSGRAQAAAQQKAAGREARIGSVSSAIAQEIADALFVRPVDRDTLDEQAAANQASGLTANRPELGTFIARSDFPRDRPEPLAIRYGIDYLDTLSNLTLAPVAGGGEGDDGYLDGYNFAPYSVNPFTNWPDRYGAILGEENPVGNPGFGDTRWLASTEPVRAMLVGQLRSPTNPTNGLGPAWGNLALDQVRGTPILSPEGLGFSHWAHLSWIATAENGFRVCWNIADLEGTSGALPGPGMLSGERGTGRGELSLGVPYEQWLPNVAPRDARVTGRDARGYLVLDAADWDARVRNWFNVGLTDPQAGTHLRTIAGGNPLGGAAFVPDEDLRDEALPNFLQLGAFGTPADEFKVEANGAPTSRNLIGRTLADADGDGWTDSLWFAAPTSSDRSTRQLVAVRVMDNSGMVNVNVATRFERGNTAGHTPSDVALVSRRESYDLTTTVGREAALLDPPVGFLNGRENDPEFRVSRDPANYAIPIPPATGGTAPPSPVMPGELVYRVSASGGIDVGFAPQQWEGGRRPAPNTQVDYRPSLMSLLGVVTEARLGQPGTGTATANTLIPLFDTGPDLGITSANGAYTGSAVFGDLFALARRDDRLTYFKAMANGGELIDPVSGFRIATLTPFGADDEIELRSNQGLNSAALISRLEAGMNGSQAIDADDRLPGQMLRSTRSREESARYLDPDDPRSHDSRIRGAWTPGTALGTPSGTFQLSPRSGAELLLDHRRHLTTASGARNELLPPRLWSIVNHTNSFTELAWKSASAYQRRGVDFFGRGFDTNGDGVIDPTESGPDGLPDDVNNDGVVDTRDDLPPYHPNIMYPQAAFLDPGDPTINPYGVPVRDASADGRIDAEDFELARRRFLDDNRKIDLRRATDEPATDGTPADPPTIAGAERRFSEDLQRTFRRAFVQADGGDRYGHESYFSVPPVQSLDPDARRQSRREQAEGVAWSKMMSASLAANVLTYRDGPRLRDDFLLYVDSPLDGATAVQVPPDVRDDINAAWLTNPPGFIGVEKQPFLMEVFLAFVYPKSKLTQQQVNAAYNDPAGGGQCPQPPFQVSSTDPYQLPTLAGGGIGGRFVAYDPDDPSTWPAVVFVVQLANPYNEPVKLQDFEIRVNPRSGQPQRFRFGLAGPGFQDLSKPNGWSNGSSSGNTYGPNVELGPCTPEEPRTAIVFSIPSTFPNGEPFPRDQWLDFLDIGAPLDPDRDDMIDAGSSEADPADDSVPGDLANTFLPDASALFEPAWPPPADGSPHPRARRGTLIFDATTTSGYQGFDVSGDIDRWKPEELEVVNPSGGLQQLPTAPPSGSFVELRRLIPQRPGRPFTEATWAVVDRWENELDLPNITPQAAQANADAPRYFTDLVNRMFTTQGGLPPEPEVRCRANRLRVNGIRLLTGDMWVTWAQSARQWLFDTDVCDVGTPAPPPAPGRGRITADERTPRWVFARATGWGSATRQVDSEVGGAAVLPKPRGEVIAYTTPPDRVIATSVTLPRWPTARYFNVFGEAVRGKPTFLTTRTPVVSRGGQLYRSYDYENYPWVVVPGSPAANVCHGEKGAALARFVQGCDPRNFTAPMRMVQKDDDFESVAELLDVPLWGPLVALDGTGSAWATLPEILAQTRSSTSWLRFPKAPKQKNLDDVAEPEFGPHQDRYNRLVLEPAVRDVQPFTSEDSGFVRGVPTLPVAYDHASAAAAGAASLPPASQNGIGFNAPLPAGTALLDAFTVDDRGARPFDAPKGTVAPDGQIDFEERAQAEDRRFRLARGFEGKLTPGLININTAPVEVLRAMPHMTRLVYDDDVPLSATASFDLDALVSAPGDDPDGDSLVRRRVTFDPMAPFLPGTQQPFQKAPADYYGDVQVLSNQSFINPNPASAQALVEDFGFGSPGWTTSAPLPAAPRVRVAEAIDLWRTRGNVNFLVPDPTTLPAAVRPPLFGDMPSYALRGEDFDDGTLNHLVIGGGIGRPRQPAGDDGPALVPLRTRGIRGTRGFDSIGELALLTRGASLNASLNADGPDADAVPDLRLIAVGAPDANGNLLVDDPNEATTAQDVAGDRWNRIMGWSVGMGGRDPFRMSWTEPSFGIGVRSSVEPAVTVPTPGGEDPVYRTDGIPVAVGGTDYASLTQSVGLSGRTSLDPHLLTVATDDLFTIDNELTMGSQEAGADALDGTPTRVRRRDLTAGESVERNQLLRGISNIVTTRSDVFTVWVRVRTIRQDPLTGVWNGTDPEMILDDSRYVMTVDRSSVDRPGEEPRILSFVKVPK